MKYRNLPIEEKIAIVRRIQEAGQDGANISALLKNSGVGWSFYSAWKKGTLNTTKRPGSSRLDLTGKRFGMLVVIEPAPNLDFRTRWKVLCDCGRTVTVQTTSLRRGSTKSCGCNIGGSTRYGSKKS